MSAFIGIGVGIAPPREPLAVTLERDVCHLCVSIRVFNVLKSARIRTIGDLVQCTKEGLLERRNFGRKSLNEVNEVLASIGLSLGMKLDTSISKTLARSSAGVPIVERGDRGFHAYGAEPLVDSYGSKLEVYESSSAEGPHAWLRIDATRWMTGAERRFDVSAHLNEAQASELIARLQAWLDEIPSRWDMTAKGGGE